MNRAVQILLLEDHPDDLDLIRRALKKTGLCHQLQLAAGREEFAARLHPPPDLILADYFLPDFGALEALQMLRQAELDLPLIVLSGVLGDEQSVETLKQGAIDFLRKDRLGRLGPAIERALAETRLRREKLAAEKALRESENRYKTLFQASQVIMILVNGATLIYSCTISAKWGSPTASCSSPEPWTTRSGGS